MLKKGSRAPMLLVLTTAMFDVPAQAVEPSGVSVLVDGPGYMSLLHHVPAEQLIRAETRSSGTDVSFRDSGEDHETEVEIRVHRLSADYVLRSSPAPSSLHERIFRSDASTLCEQPVEVSRSIGLPNVAAGGAVRVRLQAVCDAPKDPRWHAVYLAEEFLTNGTTMCVWRLRLSSRTGDWPPSLPTQDVCIASAVGVSDERGGIRVTRASERAD